MEVRGLPIADAYVKYSRNLVCLLLNVCMTLMYDTCFVVGVCSQIVCDILCCDYTCCITRVIEVWLQAK